MTAKNNLYGEGSMEYAALAMRKFGNVANELCEKALHDAKSQLHPLLQNSELDRLSQRVEFLAAFKSALEGRIARTLVLWQPSVEAVFKYDETRLENMETWDGSIHLLVKVSQLSNAIRAWGRRLDRSLVKYFRQIHWKRFQTCQSILEVHQITPHELRHGIGYAAMFY